MCLERLGVPSDHLVPGEPLLAALVDPVPRCEHLLDPGVDRFRVELDCRLVHSSLDALQGLGSLLEAGGRNPLAPLRVEISISLALVLQVRRLLPLYLRDAGQLGGLKLRLLP